MRLSPKLEAATDRALTHAGRLLDAMEELDDAGWHRLDPRRAQQLLGSARQIRAELDAIVPLLERAPARSR
jgi:hypothetical protein